ncbi:MAG: acyl-CoA dehydrogenase family protein [Parvibaculales bacterium]
MPGNNPPHSSFVLSEEHVLLQDMARQFFREDVAVANLRRLRDEDNPDGIDRDVWAKAVELGFAGILIPEAYGGTDFGMVGMGLVMQEAGRCLAATPLLSSSIISASLILSAGSDAQKQALLPGLASGEMLVSLALEETGHHNPSMTSLPAETDGDGLMLSGNKTFVQDGHIADQFIVAVRTSGKAGDDDGITLCLVDAKADGVRVTRTGMVDSRNAAEVVFSQVKVSKNDILGPHGGGLPALEAALDMGRIALSAEILGAVEEVFDRTLDYLKERKQFGVPIGSFQALRHRAAHMFSEIEVCRSVVAYALAQADKKTNHLPRLASLVKARLGEASTLVTNEGLQMHGGIGMTDDVDIGLFMKRARVQVQHLGDSRYHRDRYARLSGY